MLIRVEFFRFLNTEQSNLTQSVNSFICVKYAVFFFHARKSKITSAEFANFSYFTPLKQPLIYW
jgi:hypothetical protein